MRRGGRLAEVAVRAGSGPTYPCRRDETGAWLCGRCERGVLRNPRVGRQCPGCRAEVIAVQHSFDAWLIALVVVVVLALGYIALAFWR